MKQMANLPRRARWAVPAGIVAVAGGVLAGSMVSAAAAAPSLPPRTPAQLLAALAGKTSAPPLSGTVVETASLGLPALPSGVVGTISLPSLLAGSHTINLWYSDPAHYRLALPQSMSESDLVRNGSNLWLWGSSANLVTHMALPAAGKASPMPSMPLTPQQAAGQVLAKAGPTTTVSVDSNVTVAGEAAYQLVLAPKSSSSLIGQVRIAVDGQRNVPLRVQVFAKGATSPAFQIGFTSVSFGKPAAANFAFRPPAGAMVVQGNAGSGGKTAGTLPGSDVTNGPSVIGNGWLAVANLPESSLSSLTGTSPSASSAGSALGPFRHSSASAGPASGGSGMAGLGIGTDVIFNALLNSARHVGGSWGSGRLLQTSLVSMLVTNNGRVLAGAVTPDVLYQAVTQAGHPLAQRHHAAARAASK
jgi:outer membrane lipoprotein-sorting protein